MAADANANDTTKKTLQLDPQNFEYNLVDILGEQVSFTKSGLFPGETAIVEFDKYYRPDSIADDEFSILKRTMRIVFENRNKDLADTETGEIKDEKTTVPFPPCGGNEKSLVLASLLHRARLLRQQLFELGVMTPEQLKKQIDDIEPGKAKSSIQGDENLLARQHLLHLYKLQKFIDDYNEQQYCIHISEIAYKDIALDLDDERVKDLLKQFVFFILQGHYPLKDYRSVNPKAAAIISSLEKNPLKEKFDPFLDTYKQSKSPLPPAIAKVLEAIDLDPKAMTDEIKRQVELEKQKILKSIYAIIPEKDPFWIKIQDPNDISTIVEVLRAQNDEWEDDVRRMESGIADMEGKIKACDQAKLALEAAKQRMADRIQELEKELQNSSAGDASKVTMIQELQAEKVTAEADFNNRLQQIQTTVNDCTTEKARLQARINQLELQTTNLTAEIGTLRQRVQELEAINVQTEKDVEDLKRQHQEALAKAQEEVAGADASRAAAEAAAKAAGDALTAKEAELAQTNIAVRAAQQTAQITASRINEIEKAIQEQDEATQKVRDDLSAKTAEAEAYAKQLQECEEKSNGITQELQQIRDEVASKSNETGLLNQQVQEANAAIQELTNNLQKEVTKANDLQISLNGCEEEKKRLAQTASGGDQELGRLAGELRVANEQLADAKKEVIEKNARIQSLEGQLQQEKGTSSSLQKKLQEQQGALGTQASQLQGLQGNLQKTQADLQIMSSKAEAAETKAGQMEAKVKQISEESHKKRTGDIASVQQKCGEEIKKTKESFEQRLQQEKADLQKSLTDSSSQQLEKTRAEYEGQLQAHKQEFERKIQEATASSGQQSSALSAEKASVEQRLREANVISQQQQAALLQQKKDCQSKLDELESSFQQQLAKLQAEKEAIEKRLASISDSSTKEKLNIQRSLGQEKSDLERKLQEASNSSTAKVAELTQQKTECDRKIRDMKISFDQEKAALEARISALEKGLIALDTSCKKEISELTQQKEDCEKRLAEQAAAYEAEIKRIKDKHKALTAKVQNSYDEILRQLEISSGLSKKSHEESIQQAQEIAELKKQQNKYDKLLQVVTEIASQVDAGPSISVDIDAAIPAAGSLSTIISRLSVPAAKAASDAVQKMKSDSLLNLCNVVFLTSFLWQLNFPPLPEKAEGTNELSVHLFLKNKFLYTFFTNLFEGGKKPKPEMWAEPSTTTTTSTTRERSTDFSFIQGLYADIQKRSAGETTKVEFHSHYQQESDIHRRLLSIFNKLSHAIEKTSISGNVEKLDDVDTVYLSMFMEKITKVIPDYKVYLEHSFGSTITSIFKEKQPFLETNLLNRFIVKESSGAGHTTTFKVVIKEGTEDPSVLNYAVLYYSFLVVVRDYLNHIQKTVESQCPLPEVLIKKQVKKEEKSLSSTSP